MKKLFIAAAVVGLLYSCGGGNAQKEEKASVEDFSAIAGQINSNHNAKDSLTYTGTYTGKIPTADNGDMTVSITLSDRTYTMSTEYAGKKGGKFENTGKYLWNYKGNTIILTGIKNAPNQYLVGENTLTQLDMDGNRITGNMANRYVLKKQ
jgi:uncharacterized lipoprotein NlpE involved in copper resistance